MQVTVVGGGVAGLGTAVALARRGHEVVVFERDATPMPETADEAFAWDRRGAPQVRHSHAFLARLRNTLLRNYPDIYDTLLAEGATEMRFGEDLPDTVTDFTPQPDDDELVMLACRRTTFEWTLRRAALADGNVTFRVGVAVEGVIAEGDPSMPTITGVRLSDGTTHPTSTLVVAGGRRSVFPEWLSAVGAPGVPEEVEDTGIVYFSRFYRLNDGAEYPPRSGPIGGDLGYVKYGVFVGDNRTFSVTLAIPTDDDVLRSRLADPTVFDDAARQLVATAPWLDGRATPITDDVHVMAGLLNRWRDVVVDGRPVALGIHPIGDARVCTNPLYGRGCTIGFWQAQLLADALHEHPDDPLQQALTLDRRIREEIEPWYRAGVQQDAEARRVAAALLAGNDPDGDADDPRTLMRAVFRDGLLPAIRTDATVMRAFFRNFNLLSPADALVTDAQVGARVFQVWQDRDNRPPEPRLGPASRQDFVALLAA